MPTVSQIATEKILEIIQSGKPLQWKFYQLSPMNFVSKRPYTGSNHFLLLYAHEMKSPFYLTFHQIKSLGLSLRKGAKGVFVIYQQYPQILQNDDEEVTEKTKGYFFLRYYHIFNAADVEGLTLPNITTDKPDVDNFLSSISFVPIIHTGTEVAYYHSQKHHIIAPYKERFVSTDEYYSTIFHELAHATCKHFNRTLSTNKRSIEYKQEELFAEMTSVFLCAHFGIETTFRNSAAYLQDYMRGECKNLLSVVSTAEQAASFILSNAQQTNGNTKAPE